MKNADYWAQRFTQLEDAQNKLGADALKQIEAQYKQAQKQIEAEISIWYQRFAKNNGITLAEARQWLTGKDLKEFKWDVQDYIKYGQDNALSGGWMKELENASAKYHISKLEALKIHTQQSLESLFSKQGLTVSGALSDAYTSGYYHTVYELQKGFNVGWDIAGIDEAQLEKVLSKPWAADGYNFSERIWKNKDKLISEVHNELSQNIMLGTDPQKAIDALAKKMNTSKHNAGRLVMTEEAYFSSTAQKEAFQELGVEQFEIVATLDSHTSEICRTMDGKHFPMTDFQPGTTAPPFHVYCRSTTAPYFDDDFGQIGERAARDEETGKTYYIPDDMKYQDWEDTFVKGGDKSGLTPAEKSGTIKVGTAKNIEEGVKNLEPYAQSVSLNGVTNLDAVNEMTGTLERLYQNYSLKKLDTIAAKKSEKWMARANYNGLDVNYLFMNDPVNWTKTSIVDWISSNQTALKKWQEYLKQLEERLEKNPTENQATFIKHNVKIAKKTIKDLEEALKYSRYNVIYSGKEIQSTITHEFGHVIADQHCGQINGIRANPAYANNFNNVLWKKCELIRDTFKKAKENEDIYKISMYASTDSYEFFAECFAMYDLGEEELPEYIIEMIKAVIKE